jgi:hypothetical protein
MQIIDNLIDQLVADSTTLTGILIKTKVLAFKLKNQELKDWIDNELNGYPNGPLPPYRILPCQVLGDISNGFQRAKNYPIPLTALDARQKETFLTVTLFQSISTLDSFVHNNDNSKMVLTIPPEFYGFLSEPFDNGYEIEFARKEIAKIQIVQLLTAVKTKLLDFLLKLNEEAGDDNDLSELASGKKNETISSLFNSTVFGDNTTIIVGDKNHQTVKNITNTKGNFKELETLFLSKGLAETDIAELGRIIDKDKPDEERKEYGDKVKTWVTKMLGKALDSSWTVGLGAAGKILADGLSHYYGWK